MNSDRRADFCVRQVHIRLTCDESLSVNCTGGDEANAFTFFIDHSVTVVRHARALFVKCKADDDTLAFFLARHIRIPPDEPRLVRFHIRTESAIGDAQVARRGGVPPPNYICNGPNPIS